MRIDHHQIRETYTSAWKAESIDDMRALLGASLAPDCAYQDPLVKVSGWDELIAYMSNFHQQLLHSRLCLPPPSMPLQSVLKQLPLARVLV